MEARHREMLEGWIVEEMATVHELCRAFRVPVSDWPEHPALSSFVDLALRRHVDELIVTLRANSLTRALELAAPRCGLNPDSVRRRWFRHEQRGKEMRQNVPQRDAA